jgi:hypothetical protein
MRENNHYLGQIKKRISNCKKRLDALNDQGYTFSKEIYDDLTSFETKIKRLTLCHRLWNKKRPMFAGIIGVLAIIVIISQIPNPINPKVEIKVNMEDGTIISSNSFINGSASHSENGNIRVEVRINDGPWEIANGTTEWSYELNKDDLSGGINTIYFKCLGEETDFIIVKRSIHLIYVDVDDLKDGEIISSNQTIKGTASHSENGSTRVEVMIKDREWEIANGTTEWSYELNIDDLEDGEHTLYFKCVSDEIESEIIQRKITIQRIIPSPSVKILNPSDGEIVSGVINVNGTATAGIGDIQKVEIRFNGEDFWYNATVDETVASARTINWRKNWDTTNLRNGSCLVEVRSYDIKNHSDIVQISVIISNDENSNESNNNFTMPEIGDKRFQIYIPNRRDLLLKPNETYTIEGYHRQNKDFILDIHTTLYVAEDTPEWLVVSIPDQTIITPPDNRVYTFPVLISITDDAPKDHFGVFTIKATYGVSWIMNRDWLSFFQLNTDFDLAIYTGQW